MEDCIYIYKNNSIQDNDTTKYKHTAHNSLILQVKMSFLSFMLFLKLEFVFFVHFPLEQMHIDCETYEYFVFIWLFSFFFWLVNYYKLYMYLCVCISFHSILALNEKYRQRNFNVEISFIGANKKKFIFMHMFYTCSSYIEEPTALQKEITKTK
jgi:hypothetical protein